MAGDARGALIRQAAVTGAVDFSRARLTDPRWWIRLNQILDGLSEHNYRERLRFRYDYHLALLSSGLTTESWIAQKKAALKCFDQLRHSFDPAIPLDSEEQRDALTKEAEAKWMAEFGDPGDPDVAAKIDATAEAILKRGVLARKQNNGIRRPIRRR